MSREMECEFLGQMILTFAMFLTYHTMWSVVSITKFYVLANPLEASDGFADR